MTLETQVDERTVTESKTDALVVPSSLPYRKRLEEVPDQDHGVEIRRISAIVKTGAGSGTLISGGSYSGLETHAYKIEIDAAGDVGGAATFKWYKDTVLQGSLIPIENTDPIDLELGVTVVPVPAAGQDFDLGDYFEFSAEFWTEVAYVPTATKEFQVNYVTGDVDFHSADAAKTVTASYEGRGTLADADSVNQITSYLTSGDVIAENMVTLAGLLVTNGGDIVTHNDEIVYLTGG